MLGLIKLLLAGLHGHIPPTLFADNPTKTVDWDQTGLRVATKLHPWDRKTESVTEPHRHSVLAVPTRTQSFPCP